MKKILLEVCVDSTISVNNALAAGADRLELCSELSVGGLTPSAGFISQIRAITDLPLHVLIRPRSGGFNYSQGELEIMLYDIKLAEQLGADGVVIGALTSAGTLDLPATQKLIEAAGPLSITFHRAFDLTPDPLAAFNQLRHLGIDRLLTSGQAATAAQGAGLIRRLQDESQGQIIVMPGAGVSADNVGQIILETGVTEIHASGKVEVESCGVKTGPVKMGVDPVSEAKRFIASTERLKDIMAQARLALNT